MDTWVNMEASECFPGMLPLMERQLVINNLYVNDNLYRIKLPYKCYGLMLLKLLLLHFKLVFSMKSSPDPFYGYISAYSGAVGGVRIFDWMSRNTAFFLVILMSNTLQN